MAIVRPEDLRMAQKFISPLGITPPAAPPPVAPPVTPPAAPVAPTTPITPPAPPAPPAAPVAPTTPTVKTDYEPGKQYPSDAQGGQPDGSIPLGYHWSQNPINGMWMLQQDEAQPTTVTPTTVQPVSDPPVTQIRSDEPTYTQIRSDGPKPLPIFENNPVPVDQSLLIYGPNPASYAAPFMEWIQTTPSKGYGINPVTLWRQFMETLGMTPDFRPLETDFREPPGFLPEGSEPKTGTSIWNQPGMSQWDQGSLKAASPGWGTQGEGLGELSHISNQQLGTRGFSRKADGSIWRYSREAGGRVPVTESQMDQLLKSYPPSLKAGGDVPGPIDEPVTITAHGGERVLTREQNQSLKGLNLDNMIQFARTPAGRALIGRLGG